MLSVTSRCFKSIALKVAVFGDLTAVMRDYCEPFELSNLAFNDQVK